MWQLPMLKHAGTHRVLNMTQSKCGGSAEVEELWQPHEAAKIISPIGCLQHPDFFLVHLYIKGADLY